MPPGTSGLTENRGDCEYARQWRSGPAADAVDAENVERVTIAHHDLEPVTGPEAHPGGKKSDDDAVHRQYEAGARRDGAKTDRRAGDRAKHRGLAAGPPFDGTLACLRHDGTPAELITARRDRFLRCGCARPVRAQ